MNKIFKNTKAASGIEYGILVGLIAVAGISAVFSFGTSNKSTFESVTAELTSANPALTESTFESVTAELTEPMDPCIDLVGSICADGSVYAGDFEGVPLYTTPFDIGLFTWNNGVFSPPWTETGSTSTTDGMSNTNILVGLTDSGAPYQGAHACRDLGAEWYLPARDELAVLYNNRESIGGFVVDALYLASTEISIHEGTHVKFSDESRFSLDPIFDEYGFSFSASRKSSGRFVRCVKR